MAGAAALTIATPTTPTPDASHPGTTTSTTTNTDHETSNRPTPPTGSPCPAGGCPDDLAEQVTAAAGLVWLRRRRAYRPTRPHRHDEDAEDLAPLPATVAAIQAATGSRPTPPCPPRRRPGLPPIGFPPAGVGLTGPGALDAARGLLITVLLAALRQSTVELVITRRAVDMLLGPAAPHLRPGTGLRIVDTAAHAATLLADATPALSDQRRRRPARC